METVIGAGAGAAVRFLDSMIAAYPLDSLTPLNRRYPRLAAEYARAGAVTRAEALMRDYEREVPEVLRRAPERWFGEGMIAQAKGDHPRAIAALRKAQVEEGCKVCGLFEIGQSFDAMKQPDSVLATYEAFTTLIDPLPFGRDIGLAAAYRRIGEIYEGKGDTKKALENYGKFVDLWKNADASLQPRVAEVRKRIAELSAKER
jgi:tetratricopeptide (TPR) repeat protein